MTRFWLGRFGLPLLLAAALALPVAAAEKNKKPTPPRHAATAVQRLGGTGSWSAYLYKTKSGRVCYLAGGPQKSEPPRLKRKPGAAMVTHRPEENVANVVSFDAGAALKDGSDASLDIDGAHYDLFTKGDTAWSRTSDLDKAITEALAKGHHAVFQATTAKGPSVSDSYSLAGFTSTLGLIDKACGIKR